MTVVRLVSLALGLLIPLAALGEILPPPQQVAPHSYAWIGPYGPPTKENQGFRMNLGFVVGAEAVAVIDSGYGDDMASAMLGHIRNITERPVRYVINTNSQPHRILGSGAFRRQGAEVLAADAAVPRITAGQPPGPGAGDQPRQRVLPAPADQSSGPGADATHRRAAS